MTVQDATLKNVDTIYHFAIQLAKDAGRILLQGLEKRREGASDGTEQDLEKLNAVDIVTQTDNGKQSVPGKEAAQVDCI